MNANTIIKGNGNNKKIYIDDKLLSPTKSQKVHNHSPDGFNWGYGGSGPAQLALALLLETINEKEAIKYYQAFKFDIIASLPKDFEIKGEQIIDWLKMEKEKSL